MHNYKAQLSLEYLFLLLGLIALFVGIYVFTRGSVISPASGSVNKTTGNVNEYLSTFRPGINQITDISNKTISGGIAILWNTDFPSSSSINYGSSSNLGKVAGNPGLVTNHTVNILDESGPYFYKITSCSPTNGCVNSGLLVFTI